MKIALILVNILNIARTYTIQGNIYQNLNNTSTEQLKVYLNGNLETRVDQKGYFYFDKVDVGNYILTIPSLTDTYPKYRISIDKQNGIKAEIDSAKNDFPIPVPHPLSVQGKGSQQFFEIRKGFNIMSIAKSPMGIMLLVFGGLMLCMNVMPKMEDLQEAEKANAQQQ